MHSSDLFGEDQNLDAGADENTIIVDSWLDFVAARGDANNSSSKALNAEIKDKIQELCVRIDAMLEERKLFCAELERMTQSDDSVIEITNKLLLNFPPAKQQVIPDVGAKSQGVPSNTRLLESKRSFPGWKTASRILQALKISPKSRTNLI
jgi:hypothetical protein